MEYCKKCTYKNTETCNKCCFNWKRLEIKKVVK